MNEVTGHTVKIKIGEFGQLSSNQLLLVCSRFDIAPVTVRIGVMNDMLDCFLARMAVSKEQRVVSGLPQRGEEMVLGCCVIDDVAPFLRFHVFLDD